MLANITNNSKIYYLFLKTESNQFFFFYQENNIQENKIIRARLKKKGGDEGKGKICYHCVNFSPFSSLLVPLFFTPPSIDVKCGGGGQIFPLNPLHYSLHTHTYIFIIPNLPLGLKMESSRPVSNITLAQKHISLSSHPVRPKIYFFIYIHTSFHTGISRFVFQHQQ